MEARERGGGDAATQMGMGAKGPYDCNGHLYYDFFVGSAEKWEQCNVGWEKILPRMATARCTPSVCARPARTAALTATVTLRLTGTY